MVKSSTVQQPSGKRLINSIFGTYSTKIKNDSPKDIYVVLSEAEVTVVATRNIQANLGTNLINASAGLQVQSTFQGAKKQETIIPSRDSKEFDIDHDYYLTIMTLNDGVWKIHERNRYIRKHKNFVVTSKKTKYVIDVVLSSIREMDDVCNSSMTYDVGVNTDPIDYYLIALDYVDNMKKNMCSFSCDCDCGVFRSSLSV